MTKADRKIATDLFLVGVGAADANAGVAKSLTQKPLAECAGRIFVVAFGKAAMGMARAAHDHLGQVAETIIVTNPENAHDVDGAQVFAASHPVPDSIGLAGAAAVTQMLAQTRLGDHVVALISGGGSALLPAPVSGVTLQDKAAVNRVLLAGGVAIQDMNTVRQHLSRLKGGGLVQLAAPAQVSAFILSDVIGDDLRAIASGPTAAPIGSRRDAREILLDAGLWDKMPASVRAHLSTQTETARPDMGLVENRLIGSNSISLMAMAGVAKAAHVESTPLIGDVAQAAERIVSGARSGTTLFGGETTVVLAGDGLGGRNQELALRVAILARDAGWQPGWVFLSGGTDGRDGPTDSAGGLVDSGTLERMQAAGVDPARALANNDSYHALRASGDLLITGATGTNVADLQVLIRP